MAVSIPSYTVDDLDRFPDDGNRYELLGGERTVEMSRADRPVVVIRDRLEWTIPGTDRAVTIELDDLFDGIA